MNPLLLDLIDKAKGMYDAFVNGRFVFREPMLFPRAFHAGSAISNDRVIITGGRFSSGIATITERYDANANSWTARAAIPDQRYNHAQASISGDRIIVVGGTNPSTGNPLNTVRMFDDKINYWSQLANYPMTLTRLAAGSLSNDRIIVAGGDDTNGTSRNNVYRYEYATNKWTSRASMTETRSRHCCATLKGDKVMVIGGYNKKTSEIYDDGSNTWSKKASTNYYREYSGAAALDDGRVLVVGTAFINDGDTAEVYDPVTNTWSVKTIKMNIDRSGSAVAPLSGNRIFIAGGDVYRTGITDTTEMYEDGTALFNRIMDELQALALMS